MLDRATALKARLLVVDDMPQVRKVAVRMLRRAGFETLEAESGERALALLGSAGIDLVVTDFDMPGMNGVTLARRARREHPALAVVVMTGYADRALAALNGLALPVLEKPFSARQLVEAVLNQLS